jgi:hypothetical protein
MKAQLVTAAAVLVMLVPTLARAQQTETGEKTYFQQGVPAPSQALELTVGTGYTQPFGMLRSGVGMPQVAKAGIGVDVAGGYRIDPHWGISLGGQYQELTPERVDATRGVAATIAAQYHIAPMTRLDPFVELGTGYRALWQVPGNNQAQVLNHGLQLARLRAGFDVRLSPDIAVAPVIGADANLFLWQDSAGQNVAISNPAVNTFVFAGVQGRLDVGGTKVGQSTTTSGYMEGEY